MVSALIGYTGFVGSNLSQQTEFDYHYNSKNIQEIEGRVFDLVVCAGVSAIKWMANKEPQKDIESINRLKESLLKTSARRFVLISTIDVYPKLCGEDESYDCSLEDNHPYGKNRLELELFCRENFDNCTVIRLPALFGSGLKKNIIFDFMKRNCLDVICPESEFQYYCLHHLWRDIQLAVKENLTVVNLVSAPIKSSDIAERFFSKVEYGGTAVARVLYDVQSRYGDLFKVSGAYSVDRSEVLEDLSKFVSLN